MQSQINTYNEQVHGLKLKLNTLENKMMDKNPKQTENLNNQVFIILI